MRIFLKTREKKKFFKTKTTGKKETFNFRFSFVAIRVETDRGRIVAEQAPTIVSSSSRKEREKNRLLFHETGHDAIPNRTTFKL